MAKQLELEQTAFLYGGNGAFIEDLYARYLSDPGAIDPSWRGYFDELGPETRALFERSRSALQPHPLEALRPAPGAPEGGEIVDLGSERTRRLIIDHLRVVMLIRAYRVRGHLLADLDPLGPRRRQAASGARPQVLRLHRRRSRARVLPRQRARPREGEARPDRRDPAPDLQRQGRRRVHAHPVSGAEGLDPGAHGGFVQFAAPEPPRRSGRSSSSS